MNPIGLDRKLDSDFERNQLKMIWDVCVPRGFTKYIFEKDNFVELSKRGLKYQKANNVNKFYWQRQTKYSFIKNSGDK